MIKRRRQAGGQHTEVLRRAHTGGGRAARGGLQGRVTPRAAASYKFALISTTMERHRITLFGLLKDHTGRCVKNRQ